jgi:hypothetical protein
MAGMGGYSEIGNANFFLSNFKLIDKTLGFGLRLIND